VYGVCFVSRETLVSASWDGTIRLWRTVDWQQTAMEQGAGGQPVTCLVANPDGTMLASASTGSNGNVALWTVRPLRRLRILEGHRRDVFAVAFSPDGKLLVSASEDRTAVVWDVATGQSLATLRGHRAVLKRLAFSPDGGRLATGGEDGLVVIWDVSRFQEVDRLVGHYAPVTDVVFSRCGRYVFVAGCGYDESGLVAVFPADASRRAILLRCNSDGVVRALAISPSGSMLATASRDDTVRVWRVSELLTLFGAENGQEPKK
jgi:WD40 repeat protein